MSAAIINMVKEVLKFERHEKFRLLTLADLIAKFWPFASENISWWLCLAGTTARTLPPPSLPPTSTHYHLSRNSGCVSNHASVSPDRHKRLQLHDTSQEYQPPAAGRKRASAGKIWGSGAWSEHERRLDHFDSWIVRNLLVGMVECRYVVSVFIRSSPCSRRYWQQFRLLCFWNYP